jgi:hypothetical protein
MSWRQLNLWPTRKTERTSLCVHGAEILVGAGVLGLYRLCLDWEIKREFIFLPLFRSGGRRRRRKEKGKRQKGKRKSGEYRTIIMDALPSDITPITRSSGTLKCKVRLVHYLTRCNSLMPSIRLEVQRAKSKHWQALVQAFFSLGQR